MLSCSLSFFFFFFFEDLFFPPIYYALYSNISYKTFMFPF